ncbi:hypothetical protein [Asanoa hainanensis]|nr:hypothetical protein [Asanoa hainanensis]
MGVTRAPGLVACLRCWETHDRAGVRPGEHNPHDVDACRLCRPSAEPEDAAAEAPILGSLLPYNPVDRPLSASRPALSNPWQVVEIAQQLADEHAASGRPVRYGHDFGRVEVAVAEVYAGLTASYGPVVRPSVHEVYTRVGCSERRAQYALRALQRAGLLYQHADGCMVREKNGAMQRLAAEYELRVPVAYLDRGHAMDEVEDHVDREQLDAYLVATQSAREMMATQPEEGPPAAPVDDLCTPLMGLVSTEESGSSSRRKTPQKRDSSQKTLVDGRAGALPLRHPRTRRGYALARRLLERAPRWQVVPLPYLAGALQPLAERGWTAFLVDRAAETYGPVTSSSGLSRVLQAVVAYVVGEEYRRQAQVSRMAARIVDAALAAQRGPAVWSDTSSAAKAAHDIAAAARARRPGKTAPAGWDRLVELTDSPAVAAPALVAAETAGTADRSARILALARRRAATERVRRAADQLPTPPETAS